MKDEELDALRAERHQLASQLGFTSMEGHAGWVKRHGEIRELILAEEDRRASLTGLPLAARQLQDSAAMVAANQRMAEASERSAAAAEVSAKEASRSAVQARAAVAVGFASFILSLVAFFGLKACGR